MAAIDDATSEVVAAEFFEGETTFACLKVLKDLIAAKGVFKILYVDKAGIYGGIKRQGFSQVGRALEELGAQIIYAHSPEAKGRIERLFQTLQDSLVAEMRLNKINYRTGERIFENGIPAPPTQSPLRRPATQNAERRPTRLSRHIATLRTFSASRIGGL